MPERPDIRQLAADIEQAIRGYERDELARMLVHVFREYVLSGMPPAVSGRADTVSDLQGLSFAEVMQALQTQLDVPELELFQVDGGEVRVRVGGSMTPLVADRSASRDVVRDRLHFDETTTADEARSRGRGDLAGEARGPHTAPPPRQGISITGRARPAQSGAAPSAEPVTTQRPAGGPPSADNRPAEADKPAPKEDADESPKDGDDAAVRFSLLELD